MTKTEITEYHEKWQGVTSVIKMVSEAKCFIRRKYKPKKRKQKVGGRPDNSRWEYLNEQIRT